MDFKEYQNRSKKTIQKYDLEDNISQIIPYLGIVGEAGSVISELKKNIRDGDSYTSFKKKLKEELGDVLWYLSTLASTNDLDLEEIAIENLKKTHDRFSEEDLSKLERFDFQYPKTECFPDEFEIEFIPINNENGKKKVQIINKSDESTIGDPLTDNTYNDDGYRFHDIFHFGYVAYLGWSPVVRKLLNLKRKSNKEIDENEDGARAQITEELVSLYIYNHAQDHQLLKYSNSIDTEVLKTVQQLTSNIEVKDCTAKHWETAILNSYKIFDKLTQNNGGRVLVSLKNRELFYIGKK